ncbi:conjugal transfer protein [Gilliamella sp. B2824]|uniref:TrbM/KikA/MpfK family conjugal transfer protein n=1 Tax=Gilliamella sp. B2824 TaxID=2818019 RepID=UPI0022698308|nr:TrbM/KikA/MpfK family conjugal transfer protein [Gilliamella sp. B2824]MCX8738121.1 conjugal transfer protein [Gilliamella sp. B2824]
MKKMLVVPFIACSLLTAPSAFAKSDPCEVVLCMFGKMKGANPSECSSAVKDFFSIVSKKHGKFNGVRTSNARNSFLNSCPTADPKIVKDIISKFGALRG